ncbi:S28 family serine protease [uncultured Tenacibaculum sp.]|uniref:S28 family serine protease n=1 Tax=uncultured Tenacibaculum sp. TaxID=174713 RepID=UPI00261108D7|nr:S28 family serine protease [uncultured Tenacibaculum sp.]
MNTKFLTLVLLLWTSLCLTAQSLNIEDRLTQLPDVTFEKIESSKNSDITYKLKIKQPIDHSNPEKGFFFQKVYLTHQGFDNPTVIVTQGYQMKKNRKNEVTKLLNANQINVEHRYFGESQPETLNYTHLNLKQATADLHHIRTLFDKIYTKKWISTGISKGGSTTIFYKYFYPNDVDASISYVAPLTNAFEDTRIYDFLNTVGTKECREKIKKYQIQLLQRREEILNIIKLYSEKAGWKHTYLSLEEVFEYAVLEYPFGFWQWGNNCDEIPDENSTLEEIVIHFFTVDPISLFNDKSIKKYGSHYYQAATEMGYYGYQIKDFKDLLVSLPKDKNPHATFLPNKMKADFDGRLLDKLHRWTQTDGNKFIYIYGEMDTWTACAVPENDKLDSEWFMMKGKHHGSARIKNMTEANYKRLCATLERWLDIKIESK